MEFFQLPNPIINQLSLLEAVIICIMPVEFGSRTSHTHTHQVMRTMLYNVVMTDCITNGMYSLPFIG